MAASLLHAVGLPELITHSLVEYEERAVRLATQPTELAALRDKLVYNRLRTHCSTPNVLPGISNALTN